MEPTGRSDYNFNFSSTMKYLAFVIFSSAIGLGVLCTHLSHGHMCDDPHLLDSGACSYGR